MKRRTVKKIVHEDVMVVVTPPAPKPKKIKKWVNVNPYALTVAEAVAMLKTFKEKNKLRIHTFASAGIAIFGCSIDLSDIKKRMKASKSIVLSGPNMRRMGHGVAYMADDNSWLFLETNREAIDAIHKKRNLVD